MGDAEGGAVMGTPSALVALSGGVDSAVAALLLKRAGWRVEALHLALLRGAPGQENLAAVKRVAEALDIPLHTVEAAEAFEREVVAYFTSAYREGITPNPCVPCNPRIKIRIGIETAKALGLEYLATGHYARTAPGPDGLPRLLKGLDAGKDQSYFLHQIPKALLASIIFPLGEKTKAEVRRLAEEAGLSSLILEESQEICFLRGDYRDFLRDRGVVDQGPGDMVNQAGKVLGRHQGLFAYTVGQRRGLGLPDVTPYYVIGLDLEHNRLVLGKEEDLWKGRLVAGPINWLVDPEEIFDEPCTVKLRSRHEGARARLAPMDEDHVEVNFEAPQRAITPGQFAVFYQDQIVLGGGPICG